MKKLIAAVCGIAVLMLAVPSLFAQSSVPMVAPPVPAGEYKSDMMSTFNFNVTATDYVKPSKLFFSADYSLENSESREAALNKLNEFFNKAKTEIEKYGTIVTYNVNVYGSMPYYEKMDSQPVTQSVYSGNLNIRIEMGNIDNYEALRNSLIKNGFNYWTDAVVAEEAKIDIEMKNADHLKTLIDKKEIAVVGAYYDFDKGQVLILDEK